MRNLLARVAAQGVRGGGIDALDLFCAADKVTNAAMWLVAHVSYARRVRLDGEALAQEDFKPDPQGHTGGSLNMVPGYVGYMLANALTGITRSWIMGQGHAVAAVDAVNLLLGNMRPEHAVRYHVSDAGLSRFATDFYSYALNEHGHQDSPLGSHVNVNTAGAVLEGGYLGFADIQTCTCRCPASGWWPSSPTARSRSSAARTGHHAGGVPTTAGWWYRS